MTDAPDFSLLLQDAAGLRALARRLARDAAAADDLVQDALVRAVERPPRPGSPWRRWLSTVLRNRARDVGRSEGVADRHARSIHRERGGPRTPDEIVGDAEERVELQRALAQALLELDETDRALVVTAWIEGMPGPELARRFGITHDALRQRLSRARARLRARLDREYGSGSAWTVLALHDVLRPAPIAAASTLPKFAFAAASIAALVGVAAWVGRDEPSPGVARAEPSVAAPEIATPRESDDAFAPLAGRTSALAIDASTTNAAPRTIDREHDLHGIVIDEDGAPVVGARVRVARRVGAGFVGTDVVEDRRRDDAASEASDARGEFAIRLERGRPYALRVDADGFAPAYLAQRSAGERVLVRLEPACALELVVTDSNGRPAAGARVRAERSTAGDGRDESWPITEATLDADGRARIEPLPSGNVDLEILPLGSGWPEWEIVTVERGRTTEARVTIQRRQRIAGVVVDETTRRPIAGASVGCAPWFGPATKTDGDGRFVIDDYPSLHALIHAWADGYGRGTAQVARDDADRIVGAVTIALERGYAITGSVVDARGDPVPGAYVTTAGSLTEGTRLQEDTKSARTDERGTFRLVDVRRGFLRAVQVRADGRAMLEFAVDDPDRSSDALELGRLTLDDASHAAGVVTDEVGRPLADRYVVLRREYEPDATHRREVDPSVAVRMLQRTARSDDLGRFDFGDLRAGAYTIAAVDDDEYAADAPVAFRVRAADRRDDLVVTMRTATSVRGHIFLPDGSPAEHVRVQLWTDRRPRDPSTTTAKDGAFAIRGVEAGENHLLLTCETGWTPHGPLLVPVRMGERDLALHLPHAATVAGRIVHEDGRPAVNVSVRLVDAATGIRLGGGGTDRAGNFALVAARGARITLTSDVSASGDEPARSARLETVAPATDVVLVLRAKR